MHRLMHEASHIYSESRYGSGNQRNIRYSSYYTISKRRPTKRINLISMFGHSIINTLFKR